MSLEVLRTGPLALVQDAGRPGHAAVGVSPTGAADRGAFASGARLVGNDPARHAAIEVTLGGLSVRATERCTIALSGAECPTSVDGRACAWGTPLSLATGEVLTLGIPKSGLRSYLSVAGGIDVPPVLGSRSTDLLSGLGPPRLAPGTLLPIGPTAPEPDEGPSPTVPEETVSAASRRHEGSPPPIIEKSPPTVELELLPGPRTDWLADPAALTGTWTVSPDSNRVGVRLTGPVLARAAKRVGVELPSEPLVRGAVQLPPSGQPVVFGPDHPTTGGYPVVAVLTEVSSDRLAQCRPGEAVVLVWLIAGGVLDRQQPTAG
ncbi:MAG: biotin-dependent carboxyltransferase family protein [Propionicimonas sp.]